MNDQGAISMSMMDEAPATTVGGRVLVALASGIGNIVFATPLLVALGEMGYEIDVALHADYPETADLFRDWSLVRRLFTVSSRWPTADGTYAHVIPAIPPFYWSRFGRYFRGARHLVARPSDMLFYTSEQEYYLAFARSLGYRSSTPPFYTLPIAPRADDEVSLETLVIAPGCKTGEMAAKRWPWFAELADRFDDVVLVGTEDDMRGYDGLPMRFPAHVRSFVGKLSLHESAELMAAAGVVVANDSGLAHLAGAVGTPTLILFGPTPDRTLGRFPENVRVLRAGLPCEPCWFSERFRACDGAITCLRELSVDAVESAARELLGAVRWEEHPVATTPITR